MAATDEFKGNRHWQSGRPTDPKCAHLGAIDLEIVHAKGTLKGDPNVMSVFAQGIRLGSLLSGRFKFTVVGEAPGGDDCHYPDLLPVEGATSLISGQPAVLYRSNEAELALTVEELQRFIERSLTPEEFTAICDAVGALYEMHDDFYDPETGLSFAVAEREAEPTEDEDDEGLRI